MKTQLTKGLQRRLMYIENKDGTILGSGARIGWVTFSKTGRTVYYADKSFRLAKRINGNHIDEESGEGYWISGVKKRGSNVHYAESASVVIDEDAREAYVEWHAQD